MSIRCRAIVTVIIVLPLVVGCGEAEPTATGIPPTNTPLVTPPATSASSPPTPAPEPSVALISLVDSGQRLGAARSWDVELGDLDGDGDLDAFVANDIQGGVSSAVWLNDGRGAFTISEQGLGYGMNAGLGDIDGDGDLDAFLVSWDEACRVWLNDGAGVFADSGQALGDAGGWDVDLGDLDGDGDLDAFVANTEANTVWWNDSHGVFTDTGQRLGVTYTAAAELGDLDGDGDLDALTVGWNEPGKVWLNDGTGSFTDSGQALTPGHIHVHGMALGDVDGDGDTDAYLAGGSGHHQIWLNDGNSVFSDSGQQLSSPAGSDVALGDLDGDGDLDVFAAIGDRGNSDDKVWLNDGDGHFTDSGLPLSTEFSSGVDLGDLDGDGDLDAFVVHGELGQSSGGGIPNDVWLNETVAPTPEAATLGDTWTRLADGMEMVYVPGGEFQMGSSDGEVDAALEMCNTYYSDCERAWFEVEQPVHTVELDSFWIDQTEVTNRQYQQCVEVGACDPPRETGSDTRSAYYGDSAYDDYPVINVDWHQADGYCAWAGGRLPTEAEWEYAACGPEGRRFPWGDEYDGTKLNSCDVNCEYDWAEEAFDDGHADTAPVGSYPSGASWCGAFDLAGNVWEWMADRFGVYSSENQVNPTGPSSGTSHTLRGDSADGTRSVSRCAARHGMPASRTYKNTGFRCVVSLGE